MSRPSNILLPAINYDHTLVLSVELSNKSWVLAAQVPGLPRTKAQRTIEPNKNALLAAIDGYRARAAAVGYTVDRVITTYEAGWSGFWLARWLVAQGVEVHVVQPSSVPVDRRLRRAKSDGIDAELLLRTLLAWLRGEPRVCSMAPIPDEADEDARRSVRERTELLSDRVGLTNRIGAILATLIAGFMLTAGFAALAIGSLNLISIAFGVLFIGLAADFSIQFSVRSLAERLVRPDLETALVATGAAIGKALALSAAAIGAGFFAFLPTSYLGVAELGTVAGLGMAVAFVLTIVLLPALLVVLRAPEGGMAEVGFTMLAPVDSFVHRHRRRVLGVALAAAVVSAALLPLLRFDFNPLNLKSARVESMTTLHDMVSDPDWTLDAINVLAPSVTDAASLARRQPHPPRPGQCQVRSSPQL